MSEINLAAESCSREEGGVPPLKGDALRDLYDQVADGWELVDEHHLTRDVEFGEYMTAVDVVQAIARVADGEGHHPDLTLSYDNLNITIYTHKIDGLHRNDFILAAKIDVVLSKFANA